MNGKIDWEGQSAVREYLAAQGFSGDDLEDLLDQKRRNRNLSCTSLRGRVACFNPPTPEGEARLRDMLESGTPPRVSTDATFLEGMHENKMFDRAPGLYEHYKRISEAAGSTVKGKVYLSGLAEYPGDPRAWVTGKGDVERVCRERGWNCRGAVNVTTERVAPAPAVAVADDIVQERVQDVLESHPEPQTVDVGELAHQIKEKLKPHWAKD